MEKKDKQASGMSKTTECTKKKQCSQEDILAVIGEEVKIGKQNRIELTTNY